MAGKNINLFLMDGDVKGRVKCSLSNWTGLVYKIPRNLFSLCDGIKETQNNGIYFMIGTDEEKDCPAVYVGQAAQRKNGMGLLARITEPHKTIDFWTEAILLTTRDDYFGPTELCYLENRFYNIASEAGRYVVKNGNDPSIGNPTEEKRCELDEFIEFAQLVIGAMGYKFLIPIIPETVKNQNNNEKVVIDKITQENEKLYMKYSGAEATGIYTGEGFVVLKGSKINENSTAKCPSAAAKLRETHKSKIRDGILQEDIFFSTPSGAAGFVAAAHVSGYKVWKNEKGTILDEIIDRDSSN